MIKHKVLLTISVPVIAIVSFTGGVALAVGGWVGGGQNNAANGDWATVGAGEKNKANGNYSSILGGKGNAGDGGWSAIGGGRGNAATKN